MEKNNDIFEQLARYRAERGIDKVPYDHLSLLGNLAEEIYEGTSRKSRYDSIDWRCDSIIFLINSLAQDGIDPRIALEETCKEILSRKGSYDYEVNKWIKNINQDPSTLYKANYNNAELLAGIQWN